ncbi:hypothetical protein, partial [Leclercia adecarboxylata]|uniref:hypothetical protein n=1 Tax=Leclercia adecarboxylata TaxID=83655 RepID=UPI00234D89F0
FGKVRKNPLRRVFAFWRITFVRASELVLLSFPPAPFLAAVSIGNRHLSSNQSAEFIAVLFITD